LSTHILQEVEAVCSRVIILNDGIIAAQGRPEEIGETLKGEERVRLRIKNAGAGEPLDERRLESLFARLTSLRSAMDLRQDARPGVFSAELVFSPSAQEPGEILFDWAVANDLKLLELERRRLSLEEIFVKLTSEGGAR
jgi:ABC-2 type transport system ATP-binding protein